MNVKVKIAAIAVFSAVVGFGSSGLSAQSINNVDASTGWKVTPSPAAQPQVGLKEDSGPLSAIDRDTLTSGGFRGYNIPLTAPGNAINSQPKAANPRLSQSIEMNAPAPCRQGASIAARFPCRSRPPLGPASPVCSAWASWPTGKSWLDCSSNHSLYRQQKLKKPSILPGFFSFFPFANICRSIDRLLRHFGLLRSFGCLAKLNIMSGIIPYRLHPPPLGRTPPASPANLAHMAAIGAHLLPALAPGIPGFIRRKLVSRPFR